MGPTLLAQQFGGVLNILNAVNYLPQFMILTVVALVVILLAVGVVLEDQIIGRRRAMRRLDEIERQLRER